MVQEEKYKPEKIVLFRVLWECRFFNHPAVHTWGLTYACACTHKKLLNDSLMRWAE